MTALERWLRAARDAGCPYDQVERFLRFGKLPNLRQLEFHAAARACDVPGGPFRIGYGGARGGGKSFASALQAADDCDRYPGLKGLFLRKVGRFAHESLGDLARQVYDQIPHKGPTREGIITFPNGSRILTGYFERESDIDRYIGLEYDFIIIEEATTIQHQNRVLLESCCRSSKPGWRPRIYYTTNPGGVGHAEFKREFVDPWRNNAETVTRFIPATYRDNPTLNPEYSEMLEAQVGWRKRAWKDGDWDIAAGQFFETFRESVHVRTGIKRLAHWPVWGGFDYGYNHPTVAHLFASDDDGRIMVLGEVKARKILPAQFAPLMKQMARECGVDAEAFSLMEWEAGHDVFANRGDSKGQTISDQYAAQGVHLVAANNDRVNGAAEINDLLGDPDRGIPPRIVISNRCESLIQTLPALIHDPRRPEDVLKIDANEEGEGGDDAYDSFRYGVMGSKRARAKHAPKRQIKVTRF